MADNVVGIKIELGGGKQAEETVIGIKRQLRDATAQVALLAEKYGVTSKEATEAAKRAGQLRDQIDLSNQLINGFNPDTKFKAATAALGGLAGAFGGLQGAIGLFGVESKDVANTLLKVQSALALSHGLEAIGELKDSFSVLKSVVLDAFKGIRAAIGSTGIGLLVIAVGAIYAYWDDIKAVLGGISNEQKKILSDTQKTADAQKKSLDTIADSESILKSQGKTEREILDIKIKATQETIKSQVALLETQQTVAKSQEDIAERNKSILKQIILVITAPLSVLLKGVDEVGLAFGKNFGLVEKFAGGLAGLIFDPEQAREDGQKTIEITNDQILKLKNGLAGYKLDIEKINKTALDKETKKREEEAEKEYQREELRIKRLQELSKIGGTEYENKLADLKAQYLIDQELFAGHQLALLEIENKFELQKFELQKERKKIFEKEAEEYADAQIKKLEKQGDKEAKGKVKLNGLLTGVMDKSIAKEKENTASSIALSNAERQNKLRNLGDIGNALGALSGMAEQGSALQKGLALGQVAVDTALAISSLTANSEANPGNAGTFGLAGVAQFASGIIRILANIAQAKTILSQVPGGGGSGPTISVSAPAAPIAPVFTPSAPTALDQNSINAIGNVALKAYVVESDITGSQKRMQRIENSARI